MGGSIAAKMAASYPSLVDGLILWSPAGNISLLVQKRFELCKKLPNGNANIPNFEISQALYESTYRYNSYENLEAYKKPVLIIHGEKDQAVNFEYGQKYANMLIDSTFHLVKNANHGYDEQNEKQELLQTSLEFLKRNNL
jgi:hypothetical protein